MTNAYLVRLEETEVLGSTCPRCRYHAAPQVPRCPACGAGARAARFTPRGRVWSTSRVHIAVGRFPAGTFTYVDLDDGPRVLVRGARPPLPIGSTVELVPVEGIDGEQGIEVVSCG